MSSISEFEAEKYRRMWQCDAYATHSPGMEWLPVFLDLVKDDRLGRQAGTVLDIGCGDGQAAKALTEKGFRVTLCDLDDFTGTGQVVRMPIWELSADLGIHDYGFCCDVMEHVPESYVMLSLDRIMTCCRKVFFTICTEPDQFGVRIGETLHQTVKPFTWWRDRLADVGAVLDARDCLNTGVYFVGHSRAD